MQGGVVIGLPVYVFFFGGSSWWMLAFFPLGFAGMIPLSIMSSMIKDGKSESEDYKWNNQELGIYFYGATERSDLGRCYGAKSGSYTARLYKSSTGGELRQIY